MNDREMWNFAALSGLSLLNFLQQSLSDRELAVVLDGWVHWSQSNLPEEMGDADAAITNIINQYSNNCIREGGARLAAQERVVEVFKEMQAGVHES